MNPFWDYGASHPYFLQDEANDPSDTVYLAQEAGCIARITSFSFLQSLWWNAPEIAMEMESVFLEPAIVFQDFWVRIVQEVCDIDSFLKPR